MAELIFDIGFHRGEDTRYYLDSGFIVVAVDADPKNIEYASAVFRKELDSKQLQLIHAAVSQSEGMIPFHLSKKTVWSSLKSGIAGREGRSDTTIEVPAKRLDKLFEAYGTPHYCKIDVEGYDAVCLETLAGYRPLPKYISVETECLSERQTVGAEVYLETLNRLIDLGYNRFKLVDQASLQVLSDKIIYDDSPIGTLAALKRVFHRPYDNHFSRMKRQSRERLQTRIGYNFPFGASGPFSEKIDGAWLAENDARSLLERHRSAYFRMLTARDYGFWCDWHATRHED